MRVVLATVAALVAFATNSLLCRAALGGGQADAASFTALRLASGALMLLAVSRSRGRGGSWTSSAALFAYAAAFSFAYFFLPAGIGALPMYFGHSSRARLSIASCSAAFSASARR